ncbi:hypothetical protein HY29_17485 [Hyphomonas beringensis]|uniref:Uncharacterized protein n=1 Tax=Hyphomonas beringensis TaxID=1280946 RepID=A0A062U4K7_9PROT|nr:hypothetical protein [Hyphomonas beringensis]KCZ53207.1 hypothetical protein HY29_17485 [Hyphomonas beringensis]
MTMLDDADSAAKANDPTHDNADGASHSVPAGKRRPLSRKRKPLCYEIAAELQWT